MTPDTTSTASLSTVSVRLPWLFSSNSRRCTVVSPPWLITWTTNVSTSTIFRYGTAPNQMNTPIEQPTATIDHSITLERLVPNTTYYYQIQACTTAGQCVSTNALPFTTTV